MLATTCLAGTQLSRDQLLSLACQCTGSGSSFPAQKTESRRVLDRPHPCSLHRCRDTRCISVSGQRFQSPPLAARNSPCLPAPSAHAQGGSHSGAAWPAAGLLLGTLGSENVFYSPETSPRPFSHTNVCVSHRLAEMFAIPSFPSEGDDGRTQHQHLCFSGGFVRILLFKTFPFFNKN